MFGSKNIYVIVTLKNVNQVLMEHVALVFSDVSPQIWQQQTIHGNSFFSEGQS